MSSFPQDALSSSTYAITSINNNQLTQAILRKNQYSNMFQKVSTKQLPILPRVKVKNLQSLKPMMPVPTTYEEQEWNSQNMSRACKDILVFNINFTFQLVYCHPHRRIFENSNSISTILLHVTTFFRKSKGDPVTSLRT